MKFVVFDRKLGVLADEGVYVSTGDHGDDPIRTALEQGTDLAYLARTIKSEGALVDLPNRLAPPIRHPSKIIAVGLNYRDHCRETNTPFPKVPIEFAKHPSSLAGHMDPILLDEDLSTEVDYEVELAVVIGKRCRDLDAETALDVVAGYTISNDVSARDIQMNEGQWVRAKSFDGFTPLGPSLVTPDEIADPQSLTLRLWLDRELLQDSSTSEMVFPIAELLEFVSRRTTLLPGDILLTGTPHGTGHYRHPRVYMTPGSTVRCSVEGLGELTNPVLAYD